jgi:L-rhamnose mutarotase
MCSIVEKNEFRTMRIGSLIKLKSEYEERYIILHKHTFPGVLDRIHRSDIRNYSIFLREGILFSYFEYVGNDYEEDMTEIGQDPVTREWWKLTDPMQEPLDTRKEGEWWASMEEIFHWDGIEDPERKSQRKAYTTRIRKGFQDKIIETFAEVSAGLIQRLTLEFIRNCSIFNKDGNLYSYFEFTGKKTDKDIERLLRGMKVNKGLSWAPMEEVFHTD